MSYKKNKFQGIAVFPKFCLSLNGKVYFYKHPKLEVRGTRWNFFYHRGRTESRTLLFFKSRQPAHTPCGMKSLSLSIFLRIKIRKTLEKMVFKQFGKLILNLHTKLEEYILASFQSNFYTLSSLAIKN
jgi:hypothetical protein